MVFVLKCNEETGLWSWRLEDSDGVTIAFGVGEFPSKESCLEVVRLIESLEPDGEYREEPHLNMPPS